MATFEPEALGCRCSECPLGGKAVPVPPKRALGNPRLIVLGEAPGKTEEVEQEPFVGRSGYHLDHACREWDVSRSELHITNTLLCLAPNKGFSERDWDQAIEACRPRLERELAELPPSVPILAVGDKALQVLTDKTGIMGWCGAPLETKYGRTALPTFHPSFAFRTPALLPVFRIFVGRAIQLMRSELPESKPLRIVRHPGLEMVQALEEIRDSGKSVALDVEAVPELRLVGIANEDLGVSIPYPFTDGEVAQLAHEIIASSTEKVLHNANFDLRVLRKEGFTVGGEIFDTILAHAVVGPELPHDLGFVCVEEAPDPRWKTAYELSKKLKKLSSLLGPGFGDFQIYNGTDGIRTAELRPRLWKRLAATHNGLALFREYTKLAKVALKMEEWGMLVSRERLARHREHRIALMETGLGNTKSLRAQFRELVPDEQYELGATGQSGSLRTLFFEGFGVRPTRYTEGGEPALDDASLESIVAMGHPHASPTAKVVQDFRAHATVVSRYIDSLPIDHENTLHPNWKVHGTITGRWSSSEPNGQNWPKDMRDVVIARPGNVIVGADFSQLELRIIALLAGDEKLLEWYARDLDVHALTAKMLFAEQVAKTGVLPKGARDIAKTVEYAFNYQYSSDVTTVWKTAVVQFPFLTIARMQKYRTMWFKEHHWILTWQKAAIEQADKLKYVEAPLSGRRRRFHDGMIDANEVLNFPMQATAADLTNRAILKLDKMLGPDEHIIAQVHDAIYVEGPNPEKLRDKLTEAMTQTITLNGNTMTFPVDVGAGIDWSCSLKYSPKDPAVCFKDFFASLSSWFSSERAASAA